MKRLRILIIICMMMLYLTAYGNMVTDEISFDKALEQAQEVTDSLLSKGFYSTTDYSKWSQVVSDYDGMANMYGIPN